MNSNMNFDPNTGQPINQNVQPAQAPTQNANIESTNQSPQVPQETFIQNAEIQQNIQTNPQSELQHIPTVGQEKQDFINNVQAINTEKKEEKKEGINFVFIAIVFAILIACIFFLFPILVDYI